ncbi:hypothetical protein [Fibrella aquatilis]|uniref:Curlin associated repeat-containing protein n=1 Tax=Fibrella aquatilis TaxID=2817059 RepID=A0A939GDP3_9BACT|nr:hypothetical protein [Fibrella aquatilis]MBO0934667.1 hypothetical protein [Fibrella aquatilis]
MKKLSFSFLLLGLTHWAVAQTNAQSEAFWTEVSPGTIVNRSAIVAGSQPAPTVSNEVMLSQQGNNNQLRYTNASGQAGNQATFIQQGDNNRLSLDVDGTNNTYRVAQLGSGNELQLSGVRGSGAQLDLRQNGNGNSLISTGMPFGGSSASAIRIEQSGGARAIVTSTY